MKKSDINTPPDTGWFKNLDGKTLHIKEKDGVLFYCFMFWSERTYTSVPHYYYKVFNKCEKIPFSDTLIGKNIMERRYGIQNIRHYSK